MTIWIDAQLSPKIASWINANFSELEAVALRSIQLQDDEDYDIFRKARKAKVMSKDYDFVKLIELHGVPPQLIWITCGNTTNKRLCEILNNSLEQALNLLQGGEDVVEISDKY